jgi:predicted nucleotidyltransferase
MRAYLKEQFMNAVLQLPPNHQSFLDRFVAACMADSRVVAAFLGGSHAKGTADQFSDLDLTMIVTDADYDRFYAERAAFLRPIGEPIFLETFGNPNIVFLIYPDGAEVELWFASPSRLRHIQCGPFRVLLDKSGILASAEFPEHRPTEADQHERLRQLLAWFWHDMSHFTTAMARGDLWWANGQLEELRRFCMNLAQLSEDFTVEAEGHEKVDLALPAAALAPLAATCCPLERGAMLQAGRILVQYYQDLARPLAAAHGLPYPIELERVMLGRLERIAV